MNKEKNINTKKIKIDSSITFCYYSIQLLLKFIYAINSELIILRKYLIRRTKTITNSTILNNRKKEELSR